MARTPGKFLNVGKASNAADSNDSRRECSLRVSVSASTVFDVEASGCEEDVDGPAVRIKNYVY